MSGPFNFIVPVESRLRVMPVALEKLARMRIDALVFSADMISINIRDLMNVACRVGRDTEKLQLIERATLFRSAWSIIDELDSIYQMVNSFGRGGVPDGPLTAQLKKDLSDIRDLRNEFRHLSSKMNNLSKKKGGTLIYGGISWVWCPEPENRKFDLLMVQSGVIYDKQKIDVINFSGKRTWSPADHFQLHAFDTIVSFRYFYDLLADWFRETENLWMAILDKDIEDVAKIHNVPIDDLKKSAPSGLVVALSGQFDAARTE